MKDPKTSQHFCEMILKFRDGQLSGEDLQQFKVALRSNPEARSYYIETVLIHTIFKGRKSPLQQMEILASNNTLDWQLWDALAMQENTAEPVQIERIDPPQIEMAPLSKPVSAKQTPSKTLLYTMICSAAAFLILILYLNYSPFEPGYQVAVLSDSIDALWANTDNSMKKGTPILTGSKPLILRDGYAQLRFDNQAQLTIKGPAEFQILDSDVVKLNYGQLYSVIPPRAYGFQIYTRESKIIDLGTEFGIQQNINGDTEIHVLKGQVVFVSKAMGKHINLDLAAGSARKLIAATGETAEIACKEEMFVRQIDSASRWIWKGQPLNLADIAGGGNGFGTGTIDTGFDPLTGMPSSESPGTRKSDNTYQRVPSNPLIDGIFVPNGQTQQIVSSQRHVFRECPVTSGTTYHNLTNGVRILSPEAFQDSTVLASQSAHSLLMHANVGITYDLQAIRELLQGVQIVRFQSKLGLEDVFLRPALSNADFWILVDGKLKYQKTQVKANQLFSVVIELSDKDRFLTLVVTDGKDPEERIVDNMTYPAIDCDWCMFADPVLILK